MTWKLRRSSKWKSYGSYGVGDPVPSCVVHFSRVRDFSKWRALVNRGRSVPISEQALALRQDMPRSSSSLVWWADDASTSFRVLGSPFEIRLFARKRLERACKTELRWRFDPTPLFDGNNRANSDERRARYSSLDVPAS